MEWFLPILYFSILVFLFFFNSPYGSAEIPCFDSHCLLSLLDLLEYLLQVVFLLLYLIILTSVPLLGVCPLTVLLTISNLFLFLQHFVILYFMLNTVCKHQSVLKGIMFSSQRGTHLLHGSSSGNESVFLNLSSFGAFYIFDSFNHWRKNQDFPFNRTWELNTSKTLDT